MPEGRPALAGFDAAEAAWRLLRHAGAEGSLQAFRGDHPLDGSAESLAEPLERAGFAARPVVVPADALASLALPTLARLRDGSWLLLRGRRRGALRVEARDGERTLSLAELAPALSGDALELGPALPPGPGLGRRLGGLLAGHGGPIAQVVAASLALQLLALAVPELTAAAMNRALPDGAGATLSLVAAGVVLVALFQAVVGWIRERTVLFVVTRVEVSARRGILDHLLRLPFPFLRSMTLGERLQVITGLAGLREHLAERAVAAALDGVMALAFLVAMAAKLGAATAVTAAVGLAAAALTVAVGGAQGRVQALETAAQARERSRLAEILAGVEAIKAQGAEPHALRGWVRRLGAELDHALRRQRLGLWIEAGQEALRQGVAAGILIWGGVLVLRGELRVGTLFAFAQLAGAFLGAVLGLASTLATLAALRPQLAMTGEALARPAERRLHRAASPAHAWPVEMEDVWFRYGPDAPWILRGFTLRVDAGAKHLVGGPSGFGKSTILRLLGGLHEPERGSIRVGGMCPAAARRDVLYVPQQVSLCGGSLIDVLRALSGGAPLERLLAAAEGTGLAELVARLPMGYQTALPPGGGSFSGGERQLLVVTAAIASGKKLLLLDEVTANLDALHAAPLHRCIRALPATVITAGHPA